MSSLKNNGFIKRPLVLSFIFFIIGIIGGELQTRPLQFLAFFFVVITVLLLIARLYNFKYIICLGLVALLGFTSIIKSPILAEEKAFENLKNKEIQVKGRVVEASHYEYSSYYIIKPENLKTKGLIKVRAKQDLEEATVNSLITVDGKITPFSFQRNPGEFDERKYSLIRNIVTSVKAEDLIVDEKSSKINLTSKIRMYYSQAFENIMPYDEAQIMKTMLIGDRKNLNNKTKDLYTDMGIIHVLAISGLHVSILYGSLIWLFKKLKVPTNMSKMFIIAFLWIYAAIAGFGVSTTRAVIMISVLIIGDIIMEDSDPITSLAFAGFILLSYNSLYLWDIGFQLSFVSVASLILVTPYFNRVFIISEKTRNVIGPVLSVTLCTTPFVAFYFYKVPLIGFFTNILLLPLISLLVTIGFTFMLVYPFSKVLARLIIGSAYFILKIINYVSEIGVEIPGATVITGKPGIIGLVLYVLFFLLVISYINIPIRKIKLKNNVFQAMCLLVILVGIYKYPSKDLQVIFLDVGQGDSCVIITPDKKTIVVDGGPKGMGKRINAFLQYKGIKKIDYMILSHAHLDHLDGLKELALVYDVENFLYTTLASEEGENESINELCDIIKDKKIKTYKIKAGDKIGNDKWEITCLFPFENLENLMGNDSSAVLELSYGRVSYYLTGDIEKNFEGEIAKLIKRNDFNILKVPHHGSKTSSTKELLESIKPGLAIISCSENNRYNHPNKEVMERYQEANILTYITKDTGAVTITTNSKNIKMSKMEDKRMLWR